MQQRDSIAILSKTWVLQEKLYAHEGQKEPAYPQESLRLTFMKNGYYKLVRLNSTPNNVNGAEVVEEGRWELDTGKGYISMQTREVDGRSIMSVMLPRWEVWELSEDKLVLRQFAPASTYLVFEAEK
ncbi:hypothetical protein FJM65_14075 [Pontibacter mangrovi]|uniref:Lipocalin-like domain-containing protein n=2 Tax=Pontibacter mangrovi TaxID=2589816 RepID=A0A501W8V2_9BACT|nr:hypothetical protein FJM65_14075 [Pontibacter mangrovi]